MMVLPFPLLAEDALCSAYDEFLKGQYPPGQYSSPQS